MYPVKVNNFGIKLREGGKYSNSFLITIIIPRSCFSLCGTRASFGKHLIKFEDMGPNLNLLLS